MLALAPFLFPGAKSMSVVSKILVFILLVASYDLLLGYTGIVSFAHTMFFGIGAYGIAIASERLGAGWGAVGLGLLGAIAVSVLLSLLIGLFSLRVKAIFFAMITLAVATAFQTLASQLSDFTGGEDGLTFRSPEWLSPSLRALRDRGLRPADRRQGAAPTGCCSWSCSVLFLLILRIVNSPFGRVLQAIRENDFRAEAIGYRTVVYRTLSNVLAALFATIAGALLALSLRYVGPGHHAVASRSCSTSCSSSSSAAWARCTARSSVPCSSCWRRPTCRTCWPWAPARCRACRCCRT